MGLDGVVPGTAYTLIGPSDGSFAVDLVQNLNLSSQKVPPELLALAEKDPKWSRIKHISAGKILVDNVPFINMVPSIRLFLAF